MVSSHKKLNTEHEKKKSAESKTCVTYPPPGSCHGINLPASWPFTQDRNHYPFAGRVRVKLS